VNVLFLDGSSVPGRIGLLRGGDSLAMTFGDPPLDTLFATVESLLQTGGIALADVTAFLLCTGPGGLMGLRLCRMLVDGTIALEGPRPLIPFDCLSLASRILMERGERNFSVAVSVGRLRRAVLAVENGEICSTPHPVGPVYALSTHFPPIPDTVPFFAEDGEFISQLRRIVRDGQPVEHGDSIRVFS
jgi:hypothetical protein